MPTATVHRTVLVLPGASLVGIEILRSLAPLPGFRVHGAGTDTVAGSELGYARYDFLPRVDHETLIPELLSLIERDGVDFIYPANDIFISTLAGVQLGRACIVTHPVETVRVAASKIATHELFDAEGLVPPRITAESVKANFPLFSKPDVGHSSIGVTSVPDAKELHSLAIRTADFWKTRLVTERLEGEEVTVDCFSTREQGLLYFAPRRRDVTESGVSIVTSDYQDLGELEALANSIGAKLTFNGPWFFQAKKDRRGLFRLMEIGARVAGASGIRRAQGVNLAQLAILVTEGAPLEIYQSRFRLRLRTVQGDQEVSCDEPFVALHVDLDDTLILEGEANRHVIELAHHVKSRGGSVNVITRHRADPHATLKRFGIDRFFDRVIHITEGESKADHIARDGNSVFIDDSFSERQSCRERPDVLAVDASSAPLLKGLFNGD